MPLFTSSSPFDADVEKATDEMTTDENWGLILDICDRAKRSSAAAKDCIRSIKKRLNHRVPLVAMKSLTLLNACVQNCGHIFLMEIASREFVTECRTLIADKDRHPKVCQKLKLLIKSWAENEFKSDTALALIPEFYNILKSEGHTFVGDEPPKSKVVLSKDPNVVSSQDEEDDIVKAIALSLKEAEKTGGKSQSQSTSLYPSVAASSSNQQPKSREPRKVRALYDFEAAEDNELTFKAGEVIGIIDDSDVNWWKGVSWRGEGLFPANFVTSDLASQPEVEKQPAPDVSTEEPVVVPLRIDEDKIEKTLIMLQNADPTGESCPDPPELTVLEEECKCMQPLIDQELEKIDRLHGQITEVNSRLIESLQLYHSLMCDQPSIAAQPSMMLSSNQTNAYATHPWPAAAIEQMLSNQPQLTLGQIPQGISVPAGPQVPSALGMMSVQQQNAMPTNSYDPNQVSYQYAHAGHGSFASQQVPPQHSSMAYGVAQVPIEYASLPSAINQHQQPVYINSNVQQHQPML